MSADHPPDPVPSHRTPRTTAVVLAGGRATRLGQDKAAALVADTPLLMHVLAAVPAPMATIVVGPSSLVVPAGVLRIQEDPPGGGPVAALAAALNYVQTEHILLIAVDMPLGVAGARAALAALTAAQQSGEGSGSTVREPKGASVDAVVPIDHQGRLQPLCAAYDTAALRQVLDGLPHVDGARMHAVLSELHLLRLPHLPSVFLADIDEPADLARMDHYVRHRTAVPWSHTDEDGGPAMDDWIAAATAELGLEGTIDVDTVLDLARDVARGVERPAAPVSTYLLGVAVGQGTSLEDAAAALTRLAATWPSK